MPIDLGVIENMIGNPEAERAMRIAGRSEVQGDCWVWTGYTHNGYGKIGFSTDGKNKIFRVHRLAYELLVGPVPEGLDLDHLCRNRACWNPAHLEPVTRSENSRRGAHPGPSHIDPEAWREGIEKSAAKRRAKTHCPQGHEYTPENTDTYNGSRRCRECNRINARDYQRRKRANES